MTFLTLATEGVADTGRTSRSESIPVRIEVVDRVVLRIYRDDLPLQEA